MKAIYKQHRKRRGRSKYLLRVEATVVKGEESLPVRLVFVRNRNHRKDWLVLVTTDMSLTAEEVIRIYGKAGASRCSSRCARVSCAWRRTAALFRMTR